VLDPPLCRWYSHRYRVQVRAAAANC